MYKKIKLDNGLRIITHRMHDVGSIALGIWISVGARYELASDKGIAHFLEHLAFKGTKKYSYRKTKESIEGVGGSLNGFTSEELTCYWAKLPGRYADLALDILSDMIINPLLEKTEVEKERTVILEEIKMYKDLPQHYVYELLDALLWPNQPLGMSILGTVDSISQIKRQDLSVFKNQHYTLPNIVVSAAGALNQDKFAKNTEKLFRHLEDKNINRLTSAKEGQKKPQLKLLDKQTEQTHLALGFHSFKRDHPLKHAAGLLHVILGANMSSRLFDEIREKRGLAYEIGTQIKRFQDTGAFIVHAGVDNCKVTETVSLILKELEKTKDNLVSKDEFTRAKEFYLGQLMLALEDTLDHMFWIGESIVTLDKIYTLEDIIKEVKQLERQDIQKVARYIFKEEKINLALIGPLNKDSQQEITSKLHLT